MAPLGRGYGKFHLKATKTRPRAVYGRTWANPSAIGKTTTAANVTALPATTDDGASGRLPGLQHPEFPRLAAPGSLQRRRWGNAPPEPLQALSMTPAQEFGHVHKRCGTPRDVPNPAPRGTGHPRRPRTRKCPPAGPEGLSVAPGRISRHRHKPREDHGNPVRGRQHQLNDAPRRAYARRPSITVALELRASESVSCNGFQGLGFVPLAPPRLPYRQVSALIK